MSIFNDLKIRHVMNQKLMEIGTGTLNRRELDLLPVGFLGLTTADIQIVAGEYTTEEKEQGLVWVEPFIVKSPQRIYTPSKNGLSRKTFQMVVWVKSLVEKGLYFNEAVSGLIEEHFENNLHLTLDNGDVITVLQTSQQATINADSTSGRLFNRVFIDCEIYYRNNKG